MHDFRFSPFDLAGRQYLLLPKLNDAQAALLRLRLAEVGYRVVRGRELKATSGKAVIGVDRAGLCWTNGSLDDPIAPVIPKLLSLPKEPASAESMFESYCVIRATPEGVVARLSLRMETSGLWDRLREAGVSALTPDELAVARLLLSHAVGKVSVLTDFPTESCRVRRIGRRQYYECRLDAREAAEGLRSSWERSPRSAYLPRDAILRVGSLRPISSEELAGGMASLGDWCGFAPGAGASSATSA